MRRPILVLTLVAVAAMTPQSGFAGPLQTGVFDPISFATNDAGLSFERTRASGATMVRLQLNWAAVAPEGDLKPAAFTPDDPTDPRYRWESFDRQVSLAASAGLVPIVSILNAPKWAEASPGGSAGPAAPNVEELARFARAASTRYGGSFNGLPRVRYWQVWSEPNISLFFRPQFVNGEPFSPGWYRRMVNEVATAVKLVRPDNLVVAGGTAPFRDITPEVQKVNPRWGPLTFMRELLCLSTSLKPTCRQRIQFDIWAHHPYTSGGPTRHAVLPDDVSLGDLPEMRRVLNAAVRAGNVRSRGQVRFWVTEFSWDSKRPDPEGVPTSLHTRWVAEGLYRMWKSGVSLVTWFLLRDQPLASSHFQSGLYYRGASTQRDTPKPALRAFRFPVVAIPDSRGVLVWGRTPDGRAGRVVVERSLNGSWRRLAAIAADRYGIFQRRFVLPRVGSIRARLVSSGERSVPFGIRPVPDRFFNPFGQTRGLEPRRP